MDFDLTLILMSLIIVILIIVMFTMDNGSLSVKDKIPGFWVASNDFCDSVGVDTMLVHFGKPSDKGKYPCYIIITNGSEIYENACITASITQSWFRSYDSKKKIHKYDVTFDEKPRSIPQTIKMHINDREGSCVLLGKENTTLTDVVKKTDDIVYAVLYRDNNLSADMFKEEEDTASDAGSEISDDDPEGDVDMV